MDRIARMLLVSIVEGALLVAPLMAQVRAVDAYLLGPDELAIQGYDPVAYFEEGGGSATPGKPSLTLEHEGVVYRFADEQNRERFAADPDRYEPAYGGWCAYAMSVDKQVAVDPRAFRIGEGRLLLFVDADYVAFDGDWVPAEHDLLAAADKNWNRRTGEAPRKAAPGSWRFVNDWNLSADGLALEGYDPVAYFPEGGGKARKGEQGISVRYQGVTYRFTNDDHRQRFLDDPTRYEPQHGGWCSFAMGKSGELVEVDPAAFRLTNGQLHLFYNGFFSDTRDDWDADTVTLKKQADANWQRHVEQTTPR